MNKIIGLTMILLATVMIFSACGKSPEVPGEFSVAFTAQNTDNEQEYEGLLQKDGDSITITVTEPYRVKDTVFRYAGSDLVITKGAHSTTADSHYLPENGIPSVLYRDLSALSQAAYTDSQDGEDHFTIPNPQEDALFRIGNGAPLSLSDPASGWEFDFAPTD